jgi:hypothetical protein
MSFSSTHNHNHNRVIEYETQVEANGRPLRHRHVVMEEHVNPTNGLTEVQVYDLSPSSSGSANSEQELIHLDKHRTDGELGYDGEQVLYTFHSQDHNDHDPLELDDELDDESSVLSRTSSTTSTTTSSRSSSSCSGSNDDDIDDGSTNNNNSSTSGSDSERYHPSSETLDQRAEGEEPVIMDHDHNDDNITFFVLVPQVDEDAEELHLGDVLSDDEDNEEEEEYEPGSPEHELEEGIFQDHEPEFDSSLLDYDDDDQEPELINLLQLAAAARAENENPRRHPRAAFQSPMPSSHDLQRRDSLVQSPVFRSLTPEQRQVAEEVIEEIQRCSHDVAHATTRPINRHRPQTLRHY